MARGHADQPHQGVGAAARRRRLESQVEDRFSKDPAAAARFGIYTLVIWLLAITAFIILSMTVGFGWSWLALVGGFVVFMLVLARSCSAEKPKLTTSIQA